MKKGIILFTAISGIILLSCAFLIKTYRYQHSANNVYLMNIEALAADGESVTDHYWCCGTTNDCAKGDNATIKGTISKKPCK